MSHKSGFESRKRVAVNTAGGSEFQVIRKGLSRFCSASQRDILFPTARATEGTSDDAKCVTEILGGGKNNEVKGTKCSKTRLQAYLIPKFSRRWYPQILV